ncbi:MAG TPA: polysaccharide biosynthesis tyrosine autokinase [Terriglobales bacterium]|nr:polysaccharide biosynthesis tyrosine autokinase [Terriglobales bacterium]
MHLEPKPDRVDTPSLDVIEPLRLRAYRPIYPDALEVSPLLHYWRTIYKRRWVVLATLFIVFALTTIATLRMTRLYATSSRIVIFPENANVLGLKGPENAYAGEDDPDLSLETQVEILQSDELAMRVIETAHLEENPSFNFEAGTPAQKDGLGSTGTDLDNVRMAGLLARFRSGLNVEVVPRTRVVEVRYVDPDPKLAAEIANALVKTFVEENFRTKYETAMQTSDWLSKELSDLQLKVETSEQRVVQHQKQHNILGIDEKQNIVTAKLDALNRELIDAQNDRIQKEADSKLVSSGGSSAFARISANSSSGGLLEKLEEKEADLSSDYAQTSTQFGSSYPKVMALSNQLSQVRTAIAAEQARLKAKVRDGYLAALQREKMLSVEFEKQKQEANQLNESAIEYQSLKRDADSNRQLYQNLLQRLKEAGVTAGLRSSNVRVVDIARVPATPFKPNTRRNLAVGLFFGLLAGLGLAFLLESMDSTVRDMEEANAVSTLPGLGTIPLQLSSHGSKRRELWQGPLGVNISNNLVAYCNPQSAAAESYRALRTSILLSSSGAPPKVLLITSALPEEGKTTICANSAIVLAQKGSRVLLVDADLRRRGLAAMLGVSSDRGLSTLLSGVDPVEHFVIPIPQFPTLFVLPAGPVPPHPAELLSSDTMKVYLAQWREQFDHIIIDTPPCLSVTDAVELSVDVDKVILVARSGKTPKAALGRACELLGQVNANVMGVVLNALDLHGSYYRYSYQQTEYASRYYATAEDRPLSVHGS